tara:strand:+ start:6797 stop:6982 length:186 start_codon:yes stop_codon:yes gene_type:complete
MRRLTKIKITDKDKKDRLIKGLGKGARDSYLDDNPHGFKATKKVHKSKKKYTRKPKHNNKY